MRTPPTIALAMTPDQLRRCYAVMHELRSHLISPQEFVVRVEWQMDQGYRIAYLEAEGEVCSVAGYRKLDNLFSGTILYVDDLVTREVDRSRGYGDKLFDWLVAKAREDGCVALELDSGVQRFGAHRFYLRKRMDISSYHFRLKL